MEKEVQFFKALFREDADYITFRSFSEVNEDEDRAPMYVGKYSPAEAKTRNTNGFGFFFMVATGNGHGTLKKNIKHYNAVYIDIDDGDKPAYFALEPSAILERSDKKGYHIYWFIEKTDDSASFVAAQTTLINFYMSDPKIHNENRLMRVPGTVNRKPKRDSAIYSIAELNAGKVYPIADVIAEHNDLTKYEKSLKQQIKNEFSDVSGDTEKGEIHGKFLRIINRMNGLGFDDTAILERLQIINDKYFKGAYSEASLKSKMTCRNYAHNKKGSEGVEEAIKEAKRRERVKAAIQTWWYVHEGNFFVDMSCGVQRNESGFNAQFAELAGVNGVAKYVFINGLIKQANKMIYEPGEPPIFEGVAGYKNLNLWIDDRIKPDASLPSKWFTDHLLYLVGEDHINHVLDWLAYAVQNPGQKILHALMIIGAFGIGKTMLFHILKHFFGPSNCEQPQNEHLAEKYSGWMKNCSFCLINELKQDHGSLFNNSIKPLITDETINVREMFRAPYKIRNVINIMAFSNEEAPIRIEENDRRWYVIKSSAKRKEDSYYKELREKCDKYAAGAYAELLKRDVTHFNPGMLPEITEAKRYIIDQSLSDLELFIRDQMQEKEGVFSKDFVCVRDVMDDLPIQYLHDRTVTAKRIAKIMRKYGGFSLEKAVKIEGEAKKFMIIRDLNKYEENVKNGDIHKVIQLAFVQENNPSEGAFAN